MRWIDVAGVVAVCFMFMCAGCTRPRLTPGPDVRPGELLSRTVTVNTPDGPLDSKFAVWVPAGYDAGKEWPCVVFLHGSGECGTDGLKQTHVGLFPAAKADPKQWPCIVVMPQKPIVKRQWPEYDELVMATLEATKRELNVDPHRTSLTGLSQGGHGAWVLGGRHADAWSCVAPVCGYGDPREVVYQLVGKPVWAFHGEADNVVPPAQTIAMVTALRQAWLAQDKRGTEPRQTLYPDVGHNSWDKAYRDEDLGGWMVSQRK